MPEIARLTSSPNALPAAPFAFAPPHPRPASARLGCRQFEDGTDDALECRTKPGATRAEIIAGVRSACRSDSATVDLVPGCQWARDDASRLAHADAIFGALFEGAHTEGVTCDFGGAAELFDPSAGSQALSELRRALPLESGALLAKGPPTATATRRVGLGVLPQPLAAVGLVTALAVAALALGSRRALRAARRRPTRPEAPLDECALDARLLDGEGLL